MAVARAFPFLSPPARRNICVFFISDFAGDGETIRDRSMILDGAVRRTAEGGFFSEDA
jgi:hypothetical protein